MNESLTDPNGPLRRAVYCMLIVASAGGMIGNILDVRSEKGGTPFLSANDRSRWCTIRALVDHGTYVLDDVIVTEIRDGRRIHDPEWHTIDKVRHNKSSDGQWHYYSSKPPLLPTLLAGEYWVIKQITGETLITRPFYIGRTMLIVTNVLPMVVCFVLLARLVERLGTTDWGRIFVMVAATFGTLLTTFAVTLNNHLPAAVSATIAVYAGIRIWYDGRRQWWHFALAGLFGAFTAANELPALSLLAALGAALLWKSWLRTLLVFVPAAAAVVAPFLAVNYYVHDSLRPPYAHWGDGDLLASTEQPVETQLDRGDLPDDLRKRMTDAGAELSEQVRVEAKDRKEGEDAELRWVLIDDGRNEKYSVVKRGPVVNVYEWDNWYDFPGSYWAGERKGPDRGEKEPLWYLFHALVGHHGIFSLTPIWILSVAGIGILIANRRRRLPAFALMVAVLSVVVVGFYVSRPAIQRNYGGVTCGLRWLFWFTPLWLIVLLPAADWAAGRRWRRVFAGLLLLFSAMTAAFAPLNPWTHPWIYRYWVYLGWLEG